MNTLLAETVLSTYCFPHAAIIRRKDLLAKARTPEFPLSGTDLQRLTTLFEHPMVTREQGFTLGARLYKAIRVDGASIYGKLDEEAMAVLTQLAATGTLVAQDDSAPNDTTPSSNGGGGGGGLVTAATLAPTAMTTTTTTTTAKSAAADRDKDKTIVEVVRPSTASIQLQTYQGIIICRTVMYFIVGIYDRHPGMAVEAMERLADYFRSKNR
ncbi:Profilin-4 [Allomyces arbusculus]|nr:Profilin-4 [Allomyces arbusculus]